MGGARGPEAASGGEPDPNDPSAQNERANGSKSEAVRGRGLEPPLLSEPDPKSGASTSSAILACGLILHAASAEGGLGIVGRGRRSWATRCLIACGIAF